MAQPPAYNRTKDFTVNFSNETDHTALNSEFDSAANSINDIRTNLAILQADDGKLRPAVVTAESINSAVYDGIIAKMAGQDISASVLSQAEDYADTATEQATIATTQAGLAETAKTTVLNSLNTFFNAIFPVGSIYQSFNATPPSYGTWSLLTQGVVLLSAGTNYTSGTEYGADTHNISTAELPSHNHTVTASSAGSHTHTRGTMNITGTIGRGESSVYSGAFYNIGERGGNTSTGGSNDPTCGFDASRTWTGSTSSNGNHTHTMTCSSVGQGEAFSLMQKSIAVYIYRRTA